MAAKVDGCIEMAMALSVGVDHLLEEFVSLQEVLVLLVPDDEFDEVFRHFRLTDFRLLLASVAGRIEVVTGSPGLHMSPGEARQLRQQVAAGDTEERRAPEEPGPSEVVNLHERLAEARNRSQTPR